VAAREETSRKGTRVFRPKEITIPWAVKVTILGFFYYICLCFGENSDSPGECCQGRARWNGKRKAHTHYTTPPCEGDYRNSEGTYQLLQLFCPALPTLNYLISNYAKGDTHYEPRTTKGASAPFYCVIHEVLKKTLNI
jgi:hypothetical protein